jgi:hypothetical protein
MMCLACEQNALWYAYLQQRGLITPDGYLVEQPPFLADADESTPPQETKKEESVPDPAQKDLFSCDDPTAG